MSRRRQPGFVLILAVFLIVTLAAIGLYLITTSTAQVAASAQDENAVRAYQAARSGLEVGAYQILRSATCTPSQTITFTAQELNGFIAQVSCTQLSETEGGSTVTVYTLVSLACNADPCTPSPAVPASPTYVEREVQITITRTI